jgi:nucleoside-diphosphate-sugar epimerase
VLPAGFNSLQMDVTDSASLALLQEMHFDYVLVTLTPAAFNDQAYQQVFVTGLDNLLNNLRLPIRRVLFVSSTSVYQQSEQEWVDETSATEPTSFSGQRLLEAEQLLTNSPYIGTSIRFAGIYGPGRRRLIDQVLAKEGSPESPILYTNRIHRDDCVGFLWHILQRDWQGQSVEPLYIGVDSAPVTMREIKRWLAQELGVDPNQLKPGNSATRRNSKRCSNRLMLDSGYRLSYPTYKEGYRAVIADL